MRIDRYWKQAAAGLLAIMTLTMTGGNLDSLAMTNSQPLKAQGQMLSSPDKIIIRMKGRQPSHPRQRLPASRSFRPRLRLPHLGKSPLPRQIPLPCSGPAVSPCWPTTTRQPSFCRLSLRQERRSHRSGRWLDQ